MGHGKGATLCRCVIAQQVDAGVTTGGDHHGIVLGKGRCDNRDDRAVSRPILIAHRIGDELVKIARGICSLDLNAAPIKEGNTLPIRERDALAHLKRCVIEMRDRQPLAGVIGQRLKDHRLAFLHDHAVAGRQNLIGVFAGIDGLNCVVRPGIQAENDIGIVAVAPAPEILKPHIEEELTILHLQIPDRVIRPVAIQRKPIARLCGRMPGAVAVKRLDHRLLPISAYVI